MPKIIAAKEIRYAGTTHLPGAAFDASDKDAKLLVAIGKASYGKAKQNKTDLPVAAPEPDPEKDEMAALRAEYEEKTGRRPFYGWPSDVLREKLATYMRRDMRAED